MRDGVCLESMRAVCFKQESITYTHYETCYLLGGDGKLEGHICGTGGENLAVIGLE